MPSALLKPFGLLRSVPITQLLSQSVQAARALGTTEPAPSSHVRGLRPGMVPLAAQCWPEPSQPPAPGFLN